MKLEQSQKGENMICKYCGAETSDEKVKCQNCGKILKDIFKKDTKEKIRGNRNLERIEKQEFMKIALISISIILSIIIVLGSAFWGFKTLSNPLKNTNWVCTTEEEITLMMDTTMGKQDWGYYLNYNIDVQFLKENIVKMQIIMNSITKFSGEQDTESKTYYGEYNKEKDIIETIFENTEDYKELVFELDKKKMIITKKEITGTNSKDKLIFRKIVVE